MYVYHCLSLYFFFFFFNDTATTEIYTLSLHDALPISAAAHRRPHRARPTQTQNPHTPDLALGKPTRYLPPQDRKSTRLNSSHANISYAVFCLKKKKKHEKHVRHVLIIPDRL